MSVEGDEHREKGGEVDGTSGGVEQVIRVRRGGPEKGHVPETSTLGRVDLTKGRSNVNCLGRKGKSRPQFTVEQVLRGRSGGEI